MLGTTEYSGGEERAANRREMAPTVAAHQQSVEWTVDSQFSSSFSFQAKIMVRCPSSGPTSKQYRFGRERVQGTWES